MPVSARTSPKKNTSHGCTPVCPAIQPDPGSSGRPAGLGVVALKPLVAALPALLVLGGAEHDPGARRAEVAQVGARGVDVVLVGGDHVPAGLLEAAGEPAGAGEQVDPDRLAVGVLDDLAGPHVLEAGPVGHVDAAVGDIPAVAGADRPRRLKRHHAALRADVSRPAAAVAGDLSLEALRRSTGDASLTASRERVGQVGGDEPELAVDQLDLARASARPTEHLAEGESPLVRGLDPLVRAHRPHPLDPLGVDPQARGGRDRCPLLAVCRFPHLKTSLVGEHGRGAGAGAGGCQRPGRAGQKHRTPAVPGRGDHLGRRRREHLLVRGRGPVSA